MSGVLVAIVALPAVVALVAAVAGPRLAVPVGRLGTAAAGLSFALAVALAVRVALAGPVTAVVTDADGRAVLGLFADRVGVVLLLLVCGVSAVVQAFAGRYLRGDARAGWFVVATGALTAATAAMVSAATLIGLAVGWTLAGAALCALLGTYPELPAARDGVRRTVRAFLLGDAALWLAVGLATLSWGNLDLRRAQLAAALPAADSGRLSLVAVLVVVAALARSAQLPLQRWLPATLAAPTPVSALLHAGVVNAGGVLLVRLAPLFGASPVATHLAFVAGAATAVYGTVLMLAKPDIKGALAHSTMGQMGFMIMTCGLGAFAAAIFHLVAHGMYKATLFLGSGAAVHGHVRHSKAPPRHELELTARVVIGLTALVVPAAALLPRHAGGDTGTGALLVFGWASAGWASWGWLRRHPTPAGGLTVVGGVLAAAAGYVAVLRAVTGFLAPALAGAGSTGVAPWLLVPVAAVMAAVTLVRLAAPAGRLGRWHVLLYVWALGTGHVGGGQRDRSRDRVRLPAADRLVRPAGVRP